MFQEGSGEILEHVDEEGNRVIGYHALYCCFNSMCRGSEEVLMCTLSNPKEIFSQVEKTFACLFGEFYLKYLKDVEDPLLSAIMKDYLKDIVECDFEIIDLCLRITKAVSKDMERLKMCCELVQRVFVTDLFNECERNAMMEYFGLRRFCLIGLFVVLCNYMCDPMQPVYFDENRIMTLRIKNLEHFKMCFENPIFEIFCSL
jgi:hypothetical protein